MCARSVRFCYFWCYLIFNTPAAREIVWDYVGRVCVHHSIAKENSQNIFRSAMWNGVRARTVYEKASPPCSPNNTNSFFFSSILYGRDRTETLGTATEHTGHIFSMQGVFQWFTHHSDHKRCFHSIPLIVNERNPQHIFIVRTNCFHSRIVFFSASLFYEKKTIIFFI